MNDENLLMLSPHLPFPGAGKILKDKSTDRVTYQPIHEVKKSTTDKSKKSEQKKLKPKKVEIEETFKPEDAVEAEPEVS